MAEQRYETRIVRIENPERSYLELRYWSGWEYVQESEGDGFNVVGLTPMTETCVFVTLRRDR